MITGFLVFSSIAMIYNIVNVMLNCKNRRQALLDLWPWFTFIISLYIIVKFSSASLITEATRELIVCFGFIFAKEILGI